MLKSRWLWNTQQIRGTAKPGSNKYCKYLCVVLSSFGQTNQQTPIIIIKAVLLKILDVINYYYCYFNIFSIRFSFLKVSWLVSWCSKLKKNSHQPETIKLFSFWTSLVFRFLYLSGLNMTEGILTKNNRLKVPSKT